MQHKIELRFELLLELETIEMLMGIRSVTVTKQNKRLSRHNIIREPVHREYIVD